MMVFSLLLGFGHFSHYRFQWCDLEKLNIAKLNIMLENDGESYPHSRNFILIFALYCCPCRDSSVVPFPLLIVPLRACELEQENMIQRLFSP